MNTYCASCDRYVDGKKTFHNVSFILLSLFVWIPGIIVTSILTIGSVTSEYIEDPSTIMVFWIVWIVWIVWMLTPILYILYHLFIKSPRCPICNKKLKKGLKRPVINNSSPTPQKTLKKPIVNKPPIMNHSTSLQFENEQLRECIKELEHTHALELKERDDNYNELQSRLKLKNRIHTVVHEEYTQDYFPAAVLKLLAVVDPSKRFSEIYIRGMSFINYAVVCGIGVLINMYVLLTLADVLSLWVANILAILIAWANNWLFTVGPYGFLFGLSPKRTKVKKT